jgi:hypothetical protein
MKFSALVVSIILVSIAGMATADEALPISPAWAENAVWDDGLAEVATYDAIRVKYDAPRRYDAILLTVKEDFDGTALVKADPPHGDRRIVTVLKQNVVREIVTPNYPVRIMTSTFVERSDPMRLLKLTSGSHEWCGNTWRAIRRLGDRVVYDWSSYFDGEKDGVQELDLGPRDLLEDQLPLALRGVSFQDGLKFQAKLWPSMAHTHAGPIGSRAVTFHVTGPDPLELPAGRFEAWKVELVAEGGGTRYWFDSKGTHPLLRLESSTGDVMRLRQIERRDYWTRSP